jgi:hypothetical protein
MKLLLPMQIEKPHSTLLSHTLFACVHGVVYMASWGNLSTYDGLISISFMMITCNLVLIKVLGAIQSSN